jgi:hypothetical protein
MDASVGLASTYPPNLALQAEKERPDQVAPSRQQRPGPRGVKSRVSTSQVYGAPRERASSRRRERGAAGPVSLSSSPVSCFRPWSAGSRTSCHKRKRRAYQATRRPSRDGHSPISGFTVSVVPVREHCKDREHAGCVEDAGDKAGA